MHNLYPMVFLVQHFRDHYVLAIVMSLNISKVTIKNKFVANLISFVVYYIKWLDIAVNQAASYQTKGEVTAICSYQVSDHTNWTSKRYNVLARNNIYYC